jgi:hypothetical protein
MHVSAWGSNRRGAGRLQTTSRHVKTLGLMAILVLVLSSSILAQGLYPIYGIHFWSPSASSGSIQIQNGRQMWTVEMIYATDAQNWLDSKWQEVRNRYREIRSKNIRIILRVDHAPGYTIPAQDDWLAKSYFADTCKKIVLKLGDLLEAMIIGNELPDSQNVTASWYAKVFNTAESWDLNSVYPLVKSVRPSLKVGMYAPPGWWNPQSEKFWKDAVSYMKKDANGLPQVDCFALHAYSGASHISTTLTEDPRFPSLYDFKGFVPHIKNIYSIFGPNKPVYITETNTYWYYGQWNQNLLYSYQSYRTGWIREAFEAVDQWNKANDIKICALCWYVWHDECSDENVCDQRQNALERQDNARLNAARADFASVTRDFNYTAGTPGTMITIYARNFSNSDTEGARGRTNGVAGVDYFDTTPGNSGNSYRWQDVDIKDNTIVTNTAAGEWLRYESLFGGQWYRFVARLSKQGSGKSRVALDIDGRRRFEIDFDDPDDNGATFHSVGGLKAEFIERGAHDLRLVFLDGGVSVTEFYLVPAPAPPGPN